MSEILQFLAGNAELLDLVYKAIAGGVSHDDLVKAIKAEMVKAADAQMRLELGQ